MLTLMKPGACRIAASVALLSKSISCCCLAGSTVKTLMRVTSLLSFADGSHFHFAFPVRVSLVYQLVERARSNLA